MGGEILDHTVVLYKVKLLETLIKRREHVGIKNEKLQEQHCKGEYAKALGSKIVEWDRISDVEHIWKQGK